MELLKEGIKDWQRKRIFGLIIKAIGWDKDKLYTFLPVWCGGESISSISSGQANMVIAALEQLQRKHNCSEAQFNLIMRLKKNLKKDDNWLSNFCRHTTGNSDIYEISIKQASSLINGLKNL